MHPGVKTVVVAVNRLVPVAGIAPFGVVVIVDDFGRVAVVGINYLLVIAPGAVVIPGVCCVPGKVKNTHLLVGVELSCCSNIGQLSAEHIGSNPGVGIMVRKLKIVCCLKILKAYFVPGFAGMLFCKLNGQGNIP